ncbi:MAG: hypothetical protein IJM22_07145, partial [Treponema sp.]|nr:hypothetical protein [Treponema sp.]
MFETDNENENQGLPLRQSEVDKLLDQKKAAPDEKTNSDNNTNAKIEQLKANLLAKFRGEEVIAAPKVDDVAPVKAPEKKPAEKKPAAKKPAAKKPAAKKPAAKKAVKKTAAKKTTAK